MGKRLITQRRGRGTFTYKSFSHKFKGAIKHRKYDEAEKTSAVQGIVFDFIHCPGHTAPLAVIKYDSGDYTLIAAPIGLKVDDKVASGVKAELKLGNTLPLSNIPEGTEIYNIESKPGDGGKFVKASGGTAIVVTKLGDKVVVKLPSKKQKSFSAGCRATIGNIAGGGRTDKPMAKAGKNYHAMRARNRLYPRTSGVAMNAVDHPFGSGRGRHVGKCKTPPRGAPPGRNVGLIRSKRTGRKR
ncbi:MAG: 50S ribosomal protein L2 [Nanoarchaeota archaeon]|nr:50S ribosomal protein L2 [Nanoarchaeota archaeon]MCG2718148.1 50S ribosomal protein L2 [Nanoarchaeota archaeon]